jgi:hypothetical protein
VKRLGVGFLAEPWAAEFVELWPLDDTLDFSGCFGGQQAGSELLHPAKIRLAVIPTIENVRTKNGIFGKQFPERGRKIEFTGK